MTNMGKEDTTDSISVEAVLPEDMTPEDRKVVRRKADLFILPFLCLLYGLQFLDKVAMSYSSIMGFIEENNLDLSQYSWLGSVFYIGYLVGVYPMGILQQRLPLAKLQGVLISVWGVVLCMMAAARRFSSLMALRFLLGFFECSIASSIMIFIGQWYHTSEQGLRTGLFTSANMVLSLGGSAMAYALSNADAAGSLSIPGWKLVFIILGCLTVLVGAIFFFFIPDTPQKAFFLDTKQKEAALRVQAANGSCNDSAPIQFYQIREALTDPLFWLPGIASGLTCVPNGGLTNFFSILIQGFGFSDQQTFLLGLGNSWVLVINIAFLWLGDKVRNRCSMAFLPLAMSITGAAMVWGIPGAQQTARLLGYYLTYSYVVPSNILIALIIANTAGRTKKMVANGGYLLFYCIGNLVGPQTFREKDAPTYAPALATVVACNIATAGCFVAMWWLYARRNAQRDKHIASGDLPDADTFTGDITDRENPYF